MPKPKYRCPFCGAVLVEVPNHLFHHPEIGESGYHTACYLIGPDLTIEQLNSVGEKLKPLDTEIFKSFARNAS